MLVAIGAFGIFALHSYSGEARWVKIPADATMRQLADSLENALGSSETNRIMFFYRIAGGDPANAHGAYLVKPGTLSVRTAWNLKAGRQTPVKLTFNNLRTLDELSQKVAKTLDISSDEFIIACDSVLMPFGFKDRREYPAAFLPDTYEMYWTAEPREVVTKLAEHRNGFWNSERRAKAAELGLTPVEVATLTSIALEETAKQDEIPTVARLYLNRLKKGMKLQADPTVKFAVGDFSLRRILHKHLSTPSAYNTYMYPGLPPGPIRIADAAAIDAVLSAPQHKFIYMCAREDFSGYHNFAADYSTHQANARRYQAELNKRNIK